MKRIISCLLSVCILLTACSFGKTTEERFDEYLNAVFAEGVSADSVTVHYMLKHPEKFGIDTDKPTFGEVYTEYSAEGADAALEELRSYPYEELSDDQKICYRILEWYLELQKRYSGLELYHEPLDVWSGVQTSFPVNLAEYAFESEKDVKEYLLLLKDAERYFDDIISFEQKKSAEGLFMSDDELEQVLSQCRDFIEIPEENYLLTSFAEKLDSMELSDFQKEKYIAENRSLVLDTVLPSYEKLISEMEKLKGTGTVRGGLSSLPDGKKYYEYLVKEVSGTDKTIPEVAEMIDNAVAEYAARRKEIETANPKIWYEYAAFKYPETEPEKILGYLESAVKKDFPTVNDVATQLKYVDSSMEATTGLAFYFIPPIDEPAENLIYINGSEKYKNSPLFPTLAHEGYPGHLYQHAFFQSQNVNPVRQLYTSLGYLEGWAIYAEMYAYSFTEADEELLEAIRILELTNMAFYARADIGVHYEDWTAEDIYSHFEYAGITAEQAEYLEDFTQSYETHWIPYFVGYLEIEELKAFSEEELGEAFDIEEFHRVILETGPAPFAIVREQVSEGINSKIAE